MQNFTVYTEHLEISNVSEYVRRCVQDMNFEGAFKALRSLLPDEKRPTFDAEIGMLRTNGGRTVLCLEYIDMLR